MNRRAFLTTATAAAMRGADARPNILMLMTDSLRAECLGCYGNPVIRTPHLDALAGQGVRFTHTFSQHTVCMPTRATLMTGRYPNAHGVWANGVSLPKSEITLPMALSQAGYHTWMAGKLHLEAIPKRKLPADGNPYYGFQEYAVSDNDLKGPYLDFLRDKYPQLARAPRGPLPIEAQQSTWIADRTVSYLRSRRGASTPFFAYASFIDPRQNTYDPPAPYNRMYGWEQMPPPQRRAGELDNKPPVQKAASEHLRGKGLLPDERELRRIFTQYYGSVSFVDACIGRILKTLEEEGLAGNTIVVFTVDHGEMIGDHWLRLKGPWMYDLVTHVPMIWRWPEHFRTAVRQEFIEQVDLLPTMLDLVGVAHPAGVQGRSLGPMLAGSALGSWRDAVLIQDRDSSELEAHGMQARDMSLKTIRTREWKLVFYQGKPYGELYDLVKDPQEYVNLWDSAAHRSTRQDLIVRLLDLYAGAEDPLPARVSAY